MELQVGVKVFLKNSEGKYLLLERNTEKYPDMKHRAKWDVVGGRINIGTSLLENLKREVYEETKLELKSEPVLIAAEDILRPDKHVVRLTYSCGITGEPRLSEEHHAFIWASPEELRTMDNLDEFARSVINKNLIQL